MAGSSLKNVLVMDYSSFRCVSELGCAETSASAKRDAEKETRCRSAFRCVVETPACWDWETEAPARCCHPELLAKLADPRVKDCSSLVARRSSLVARRSSLVARRSSLVARRSSLAWWGGRDFWANGLRVVNSKISSHVKIFWFACAKRRKRAASRVS